MAPVDVHGIRERYAADHPTMTWRDAKRDVASLLFAIDQLTAALLHNEHVPDPPNTCPRCQEHFQARAMQCPECQCVWDINDSPFAERTAHFSSCSIDAALTVIGLDTEDKRLRAFPGRSER